MSAPDFREPDLLSPRAGTTLACCAAAAVGCVLSVVARRAEVVDDLLVVLPAALLPLLALLAVRVVTLERARARAKRDSPLVGRAPDASVVGGDLLAEFSHELRTSLSGVLGMTNLLLETKLNAEQREYAHSTAQCAQSLLHVVDGMLDFAKLATGRVAVENVEFVLDEVVESALDSIVAIADEKRLNVAYQPALDAPERVVGDAGRVRQVLMNLLANAVRFTERGDVVVTLEPAAHERRRRALRFAVRDTGIGIGTEVRRRLFDANFRYDASITGGAGLGLTMSRRIVDLMGGTMGIDVGPGPGSTVWFEVPCATSSRGAASAPQFAGMRGLVVDDQRARQEGIVRRLARLGFKVEVDDNATRAAARLRAMPLTGSWYHVVLVDLATPDANELIRTIGDLDDRARPGLVAFSAPSCRQAAETRYCGSRAIFVTRPPRRAALVAAIEAAVAVPDAPSGSEPTAPRPQRVLLVDDNHVNRKLGCRVVQRLGATCDTAENGEQAVQAVMANEYDLVLMDVQMPLLDGCEATRRIRVQEGSRRRTRIVALSADELDRARWETAGMDAFLMKPLSIEEVARVLSERGVPRNA